MNTDTFMDLRALLEKSRKEGSDIPLSTIGTLVAQVCRDQFEAEAVVRAISREWNLD